MKKILTLIILFGFFFIYLQPLFSQEEEKNLKKESQNYLPQKTKPTYNPAGRRDPFKDLLGGREVKEKSQAAGLPQLAINDVVLVGIAKSKAGYKAIVNGPQDFPFFLKKGDKLSDGYVLSIDESKVIFRKIKERGVPLIKPRDIVKSLYIEER